ncbi:MAG: DMT family transporter [Deltaproteobacteria bacterium]|nr:DMT family transporter [Deltaproteobacteria bacterium]
MANEQLKNAGGGQGVFFALMAVSMAIWGGSWVSAKVVSTELGAEALTFWRFVVTVAVLLPLAWKYRKTVRVTKEAAFYTVLGAACLAFYSYVFFTGLRVTGAGAAGVIVTTITPVITFAIAAAFLKEKISKRAAVGLSLGVVGGFILLHAWEIRSSLSTVAGSAMFLVCSFFWALLTVCGKKASEWMSPVIFSIATSAVCMIMFLVLGLFNGSLGAAFDEGTLFWANIVYLGAISGAAATTVYFFASARLGPGPAASFSYLVPVCAVGLSWLILGERPTMTTIIGGSIAITAVYLINSKGSGEKEKDARQRAEA